MTYGKTSLAAAILLFGATSVSASDINSAAANGANAVSEYGRAFPLGDRYDPKQVLKQLDRVCASDSFFDRRRCNKAWRIINDAHAKLQAKRAAEAATSGGAIPD